MCTAIFYKNPEAFFGRNLDVESVFGENAVIIPRNYPLNFRRMPDLTRHYSIAGTARIEGTTPLLYDGINEHGLFGAALSFPENAVYLPEKAGENNAAPFEILSFVLGSCSDLAEAKNFLNKTNILSMDYSKDLPNTPLHWFFADETGSISAEPLKEGLETTENPPGVLTNSPPFEHQMLNLKNYLSLSPEEPENRFSEKLDLDVYSNGMGAFGLPGDFSSASRFVKAAFVKENLFPGKSETDSVTGVFHILGSVEQPEGPVKLKNGKTEKTVYSCCACAKSKKYYYKTYENSRISVLDLKKEDPEGETMRCYPIYSEQDFLSLN